LGRVLRVPADFGVHPMTLSKWLWKAYVEDGMKPELALDGIPVTVAAGTSGPIRVTSRAELAAVVRYLLGFQPEQSLLLPAMQQRRLVVRSRLHGRVRPLWSGLSRASRRTSLLRHAPRR
jgi:hypothetical protein